MKDFRIPILLAVLVGLALVFGLSTLASGPVELSGSVIDPPSTAPEISLLDQFGKPFRLSDQRGALVVVFFGYTSCPDVCPTTLKDFKEIFSDLGEEAANLRFVFVTVDPLRDTPEKMRNYLGAFNPDFVGLTGGDDALQAVYDAFGVSVSIQPGGSSPGYLVEHTGRTYLIDRSGQLVETFPYGLSGEAMRDDILYWTHQ